MRVFQFADRLPAFKNPVITIGTFDGVHIGHQQIIHQINQIAKDIKGESVLITFFPHPRLVLHPENNGLKLINTLQEKIKLLDQFGVDNLVIHEFDRSFAAQSPSAYIENFLVKRFHPKAIVIGYDHRFGKNRSGGIEDIMNASSQFDYEVIEIPKQVIDEMAISSTKIRHAIENGKIKDANRWLGLPFMLTGKVVTGENIGTSLGFPTANLQIGNDCKIIPGKGVYAVKVNGIGKQLHGMLYIGNRPTFDGASRSIEVNIFDFDENIYGQIIQLELISEIRGDIKFQSSEELIGQMQRDKVKTLEILGQSSAL
jgi:riboflavin kinase / FMN adenylyltransferase